MTSRGSPALSATANIQPLWATHEPQMDELTIPFLGERRSAWQYPFRALQAAGAALCAGSDWPVSSPNPLWGAHVAVNRSLPAQARSEESGGRRRADSRRSDEPFLPGQALSLAEILAAYTSGSARVNGLDAVTGSIRAGSRRRLRRRRRRPQPPARPRDRPGGSDRGLGPWPGGLPAAMSPPRAGAARSTQPRRKNGAQQERLGCGRRHSGNHPHGRRLRPVGRRRRRLGQRLRDEGTGRHDGGRHQAGVLRDLGGLPGRELARPHLRL